MSTPVIGNQALYGVRGVQLYTSYGSQHARCILSELLMRGWAQWYVKRAALSL